MHAAKLTMFFLQQDWLINLCQVAQLILGKKQSIVIKANELGSKAELCFRAEMVNECPAGFKA